jgi:hypothetical protein
MAHTHHCHVCNIPTAICDGACAQADQTPDCADAACLDASHGHHYCTQHHPDPQYHKDMVAPPGRK